MDLGVHKPLVQDLAVKWPHGELELLLPIQLVEVSAVADPLQSTALPTFPQGPGETHPRQGALCQGLSSSAGQETPRKYAAVASQEAGHYGLSRKITTVPLRDLQKLQADCKR